MPSVSICPSIQFAAFLAGPDPYSDMPASMTKPKLRDSDDAVLAVHIAFFVAPFSGKTVDDKQPEVVPRSASC